MLCIRCDTSADIIMTFLLLGIGDKVYHSVIINIVIRPFIGIVVYNGP